MSTVPGSLAPIALAAVVVSAILAMGIGWRQRSKTRRLSDLIPLRRGRQAAVKSRAEFSATTVSATISLATVVMAYFELAGYFGPWLFWTVLTTAGGLLAVRLFARRITISLEEFGDRIPTLHEFIGSAFRSRSLTVVAATATSLGYLSAFAVELTVGSRLFSSLVPGPPEWIVVLVLAAIGFSYTAAGGFRAVVLTDRLQMAMIWLFIAGLSAFYLHSLTGGLGIAASWRGLPEPARTLDWRPGLGAFLLGVFLINVPSYVADISMWQRVSSTTEPSQIGPGLTRSALSATLSWGLLALLAILAPAISQSSGDLHPLASLMTAIAAAGTTGAYVVLFVCVGGLFAAMMSTASTMLVAVGHTVFEDVLSRDSHLNDDERADSSEMLRSARVVLVLAAIGSVLIVELLSYARFTIADFVFAIYGAQLALFPPLCAALYARRSRLKPVSGWATAAIVGGFAADWVAALYGKLGQSDTLVFLAPVVSLAVSAILLLPVFLRKEAEQ